MWSSRRVDAIQPKIQRAADVKLGNWAHWAIQRRLRSKDKKLITEAPIPGGTGHEKEINVVGFADLYKARRADRFRDLGRNRQNPKELPGALPSYKYVNMRTDYKQKATSESQINFGPKIQDHKKDTWDFSPNFPVNFQIGEIKPLFPTEFPESLAYHGTGFQQAGNLPGRI